MTDTFGAGTNCFLFPVLLLPSNCLLYYVWSFITKKGEEPDGKVEARTPGLDGDDFKEPYREEMLVELVPGGRIIL